MSASVLASAAPPYAVSVWADGFDLFAEIPGNPPHVMKLSLTEAGLSKALHLLCDRHRDSRTGRYQSADRVLAGKPKATEGQRNAALEVLRKMGLV